MVGEGIIAPAFPSQASPASSDWQLPQGCGAEAFLLDNARCITLFRKECQNQAPWERFLTDKRVLLLLVLAERRLLEHPSGYSVRLRFLNLTGTLSLAGYFILAVLSLAKFQSERAP
ncbi:hypothetical protein O3P69_002531 [Scylla paramamosain]|uniref:Uncharacterized protein n=1 Tax=Scylla paramamosain TaxID=85552 RepID=A0AAW0UKZ1_SCYPA